MCITEWLALEVIWANSPALAAPPAAAAWDHLQSASEYLQGWKTPQHPWAGCASVWGHAVREVFPRVQ